MLDSSLLPEPCRTQFEQIQRKLESDDTYDHVEWIDRVRLWQAMNETHGFGPSDCRRAVLCARTVWPILPLWENAVAESPDMIPAHSLGNENEPRAFLRDCTLTFLGRLSRMHVDDEERRIRKLDDMWTPESEPIGAVLPAIMDAGNFLLFAHIDNVESEYEQEIFRGVLSGEYNDRAYDCCDWDDRDCYFYAAGALSGDLIKGTYDSAKRKEFWRTWLKDVFDVNVLPLENLKAKLERFLD